MFFVDKFPFCNGDCWFLSLIEEIKKVYEFCMKTSFCL